MVCMYRLHTYIYIYGVVNRNDLKVYDVIYSKDLRVYGVLYSKDSAVCTV